MRVLNKLKKILELNTPKERPGTFALNLEAIISSCVYYYYHEGCYEHYRPCTVPAYSMEHSSKVRAKRHAEIWEKLDTEYGIDKLEASWNLFEDERSKYLFSLRILNNLYDHPLVRLPIFYSSQYDILGKIEKLAINDDSISLWNGILCFKEFALHSLGIDLTIWGGPDGIFMALPGFPWVADLLMSFPEGTNEGYGPIFSDSRADRALVC